MDALKKYLFPGLFIIVLAVGFFLRTYHFDSWLHFELDQARDAKVVDEAYRGNALDLPLLGPKAGGTFLRLAPGFYYLQYLSGLVFGQTPSGIAFFVALLSFLSIPLFYLLVRRAFSKEWSLALTALFAVSAYMVMYGRFAWNPNLIPFFSILGFYSLLRAVDPSEAHRTRWFLSASFSLGLATHFHFLAFLALPVIVAVFLLLKRARFSWKAWLGAVAIVFVLYLPMLLNEIEAGWTNTEEFLGAITEKSSKEDHNLVEKTIRNISEYALNGMVVLSGFEGATFPAIVAKDGVFGSVCDSKCDQGKWYGVLAVLLLGAGGISLLVSWWRARERRVSDFYLLSILWFGVSFVLFLPLSYGIAPRFYLLSVPLFFIMLGSLFGSLKGLLGERKARTLFLAAVVLLVASNLYFLNHRFGELARAKSEAVESAPDRILKERIRVTLEQQEEIVSFFEARQRATGYPIYMFSEPQHRRALKYLMERRGIVNDVLGFSGIYREGEYYLVLRAKSDLEDAVRKYRTSYEILEPQSFGTLVMIELVPKPEAIMGERQDFSEEDGPSDSKAPPRYTWREFLERNQKDETTTDDILEEQEDKAAN
ncbi:MAG: hypothetical protein A2808_01165 [Candidatus Moranbacteria bacterium RIFCSPHIGHO2_01_FULL_55_24]|nr:MAG: hypothetical protein A2808_01165 [Candidatus Moranbacteria bacterium RIFCSPHIGHO2_01_FULL_55_24]